MIWFIRFESRIQKQSKKRKQRLNRTGKETNPVFIGNMGGAKPDEPDKIDELS